MPKEDSSEHSKEEGDPETPKKVVIDDDDDDEEEEEPKSTGKYNSMVIRMGTAKNAKRQYGATLNDFEEGYE